MTDATSRYLSDALEPSEVTEARTTALGAAPAPAPSGPTRVAYVSAPDAAYTRWLLQARTHAAIRSDLRRADIAALEARAYRHLARFWAKAPWLRTPILLHAALASNCPHVAHTDQRGLGTLARILVTRGFLAEGTVGARLLAIQRMDLPTAHRLIAPLLRTAEASGAALDWHALYRTYRAWDHPDLKTRTQVRRRVLEQFHS